MADLIRTLEADLFGAYELAAEAYDDLMLVPEAPDRAAVARGLLRAHEALAADAEDAVVARQHQEAAMAAADALAEAEADLDDKEAAAVAALEGAREALLAGLDVAAAEAFVAAFEAAWVVGPQDALFADAILACVARSNVLGARGRGDIEEGAKRVHHAEAAKLYETLAGLLGFRVGTGSFRWRETAQSAFFRAAVAWRFAGDEAAAVRAQGRAGPVPGEGELQGRGLKK